jgi:hypothetical protein
MTLTTIIWTPYALVLLLTAILSVALGRYAWRWRTTPGGRAFALLLFAAGEWALLSGLEKLVVDLSITVFFAKLEYIGIVSVAPLWLLFTLGYTQSERRPSAGVLIALWIIPALTVFLALTNEGHGWIWSQVFPAARAAGSFAIYHHGPWFYLIAAYSYLLLLAGSAFLLWAICGHRDCFAARRARSSWGWPFLGSAMRSTWRVCSWSLVLTRRRLPLR